jgi:ABC-type uncharacterized transport system substrate-binding protein
MWYRALGCIVALTASLVAAPLEVDAQPSAKVATIVYLSIAGGAPGGAPLAESFRQGLQDLGYVEGKTIAIVYRSAEGKPERLPALAAELAQLPVDVILAQSGQVAEAAKDTTGTIPIVTVSGADPVAIGLARSLRPAHLRLYCVSDGGALALQAARGWGLALQQSRCPDPPRRRALPCSASHK